VIVLGIIKYVSDRSGATILHFFYVLGSGLMLAYIYSFIQTWYLHLFTFLSRPWLANLLDFVVNIAPGIALFAFAQTAINIAVDAVAKAQVKPSPTCTLPKGCLTRVSTDLAS
jgi:hypothetical protein